MQQTDLEVQNKLVFTQATNYLFENPVAELRAVTTSTWGALCSCPGRARQSHSRDTVKSSKPSRQEDDGGALQPLRAPGPRPHTCATPGNIPLPRHMLPPQGAAMPGSVSLQQPTQGAAAAAAAGSSPRFFAAVAITTRWLGWNRGAARRWLLGRFPTPRWAWEGAGTLGPVSLPQAARSLCPSFVPAPSSLAIWGFGDCTVIKGLKPFSVPFDFTE